MSLTYQFLHLILEILQVNPKAADSLADPDEYPNMFDDWQLAVSVESKFSETRYFCVSCLYAHVLRN